MGQTTDKKLQPQPAKNCELVNRLNVIEGKTSRKLANGQNIDYSENNIDPRGSSVPALGLTTCLCPYIQTSELVLMSGERLHNHWTSG